MAAELADPATTPEPRRRHGIRHRAAVVIVFAVAAVLAGADSVTAISEWASDVPAEVLAALGARTDRRGLRVPPSRSTFRRVLRRLDAQAVAAASGTWLKAQVMAGLADAEAVIIALDGKTVRGARVGRTGTAPAIRNTSIAVLRLCGFTVTAFGRRWAAHNPARTVAALGLTC